MSRLSEILKKVQHATPPLIAFEREDVMWLIDENAKLRGSLQEMTQVAAIAFRVFAECDEEMFNEFEKRIQSAGIKRGFGVRANAALDAAKDAK